MTSRVLPERPNLEQLKKQAKSLLSDVRAGDLAARERFAILPSCAGRPIDDVLVAQLALHDAQSVIARELGYASWNALRDEVEIRALALEAAIEEFVRAAGGGARDRAERLLARHPGIRGASLETAIQLCDADDVVARIAQRPQLATLRTGVLQWPPLLYACHTCLAGDDPQRLESLVRIARVLLDNGADPNAEYHWNWHPELPRTALWAAVCVINYLPLAKALLQAGARATDGVTAHIAGGGGNVPAIELLQRHGLDLNGLPGGVPPLVYMMTWATKAGGPLWLLTHGADPNLAWGEDGEAPLHVAARRWDVPMVRALVQHGADVHRRRADGRTPHTLAELHGHQDIAAELLALGAIDELSMIDRFAAACTRGDRALADQLLASHPSIAASLTREHHLMLATHAEAGRADVLTAMLSRGFDPNVTDKDGVTPLHRAAMAGSPEATRVLIAAGARLDALDGMFSATPLLWAAEGRNHAAPGSDHVAAARELIRAGSPLDWQPPAGAPSVERTLDTLAELIRDATLTSGSSA